MPNVADPNPAGPDEVTHQPTPSKAQRALGASNGSRRRTAPVVDIAPSAAPEPRWRENIAPKTPLDAEDRRDGRATASQQDLALLMQLEKHRNWLKWQQMLRRLIFCTCIISVTTGLGTLLTVAGFSAPEAVRIITLALVSALGGFGLGSLATKVMPWGPSRREKGPQDKSSS